MNKAVNVTEWVGMFQAIGLSEETMREWHEIFEVKHPDGHQSFLEWLGMPPAEVDRVRACSRSKAW